MGYKIVEEDLGAVEEEALAVLSATRSVPLPPERYDWLYRRNPDGPAVFWSIRNDATGELAGFTVALPRRMRVGGEKKVCWNGADFSMLPKHCTLGPSIKLRRAAKEGIDSGRADFLYAHPNAKMQLIHERVGHFGVGRMVRYALPLRVWPYLARRIGNWSKLFPWPAPQLADGLFRAARWRPRSASTTTAVSPAEGFDSNFDDLFEELSGGRSVIGVRDRAYLQWRYGENPLERYGLATAKAGSRLRGYAVFSRSADGDMLHVKDLFAATPAVQRDLLEILRREGVRSGASVLSMIVLEGHPLEPVLKEAGFSPRPETSTMFGYARDGDPVRSLIASPEAWYLAVGDRDV